MSLTNALFLVLCSSTATLYFSEAATVPIGESGFRVNYNVTDKRIVFDIVVRTQGWVAIGFNENKDSKLIDYFVGNVSAGSVRGQDCWVAPKASNKYAFDCVEPQNWSNIRGSESCRLENNVTVCYTEFHVERDFDTKDKKGDMVIQKKKQIMFYYATNHYSDNPLSAPNLSGYQTHTFRNGGTYAAPVVISTLLVALAVSFKNII